MTAITAANIAGSEQQQRW